MYACSYAQEYLFKYSVLFLGLGLVFKTVPSTLTLLHSEWPNLCGVLAIVSATGLREHQKHVLISAFTIKFVA